MVLRGCFYWPVSWRQLFLYLESSTYFHSLLVHKMLMLRWSLSCWFPLKVVEVTSHSSFIFISYSPYEISVVYIKGYHLFWYKGYFMVHALKAVYVDIMHLCVTCVKYSSTHLTWVEEFRWMFFWKKNVVLVCEFIIKNMVHITSSVKIDLF